MTMRTLLLTLLFCTGTLHGTGQKIEKEKQDTSRFRLGKYKIMAVNDGCKGCDTTEREKQKAITWWGGIDFGVNGYMNNKQSLGLSEQSSFMELDYGRSFSLSINIFEQRLPIYREYVGLVTGVGLDFKSYALRKEVQIMANEGRVWGETYPDIDYDKNKFKATYLEVPLMLQFNTSQNPDRSFHLASGIYGGLRIGSQLKQSYEIDNVVYESTTRNDFNLNPFKYGLITRAGYGKVTLFAKYGLSTLFLRDAGPELYPFTIGVQLIGF